MTRILFIRHGNIDMADSIPGRLPDVHLSDAGRKQSERIADMLNAFSIDAIYTSPLDRTRETAGPLAQKKDLTPEDCDNLLEIDFGEWTGRSFQELESNEKWKQFHYYRNGCRIPGGELMIEVQARMVTQAKLFTNQYPHGTIAVFSHNDPIKSVLAYYLGISTDLFLRLRIDTGSVSIVDIDKSVAIVRCINQIPN